MGGRDSSDDGGALSDASSILCVEKGDAADAALLAAADLAYGGTPRGTQTEPASLDEWDDNDVDIRRAGMLIMTCLAIIGVFVGGAVFGVILVQVSSVDTDELLPKLYACEHRVQALRHDMPPTDEVAHLRAANKKLSADVRDALHERSLCLMERSGDALRERALRAERVLAECNERFDRVQLANAAKMLALDDLEVALEECRATQGVYPAPAPPCACDKRCPGALQKCEAERARYQAKAEAQQHMIDGCNESRARDRAWYEDAYRELAVQHREVVIEHNNLRAEYPEPVVCECLGAQEAFQRCEHHLRRATGDVVQAGIRLEECTRKLGVQASLYRDEL